VPKGKYFHQADFLAARNKKNSSHTWRAILAGRKALKVSLIMRIGDGESTDILPDRWIPGAVGRKPICQLDGGMTKYVCNLMEVDGSSWNEQALLQNLLPVDAQAIRRIPLGKVQEDLWAWEGERHGMYSV
jgi:hypothetical protein